MGAYALRKHRGLLARRAIKVGRVKHIGKEANELEKVQAGLVPGVEDVLTVYRPELLPYLHQVLVRMPRRRILSETRYSKSYVKYLRKGEPKPSQKAELELTKCAAKYALEELAKLGIPEPQADADAVIQYAEVLKYDA